MQDGPDVVQMNAETSGPSSYKQRVITGFAVAILAVITISSRIPAISFSIVAAVVLICGMELGEIIPSSNTVANVGLISITFLALYFCPLPGQALACIAVSVTSLLLFGLRRNNKWVGMVGAAWWAGAGLAAALALQSRTQVGGGMFGLNLTFMALTPVWLGDTFAYLFGRKFGRTPLAPSISPKKTWEGAWAHCFGAFIASIGLGVACGVPMPVYLGTALIATVFGQLGDLLQSGLKRQAQKKDSGQLLPGHGGMLDRLDSMILAAPIALLFLWLTMPTMFHVKQ